MLDFFETRKPENEETFWGDDIHTDPADLHRVYFQNVMGFEMMHQFNVGMLCWADPSLDFQQPQPVSEQGKKKACPTALSVGLDGILLQRSALW